IEAASLVARAEELGGRLKSRLLALQERAPRIGDVRGRGAMVAIELVKPGTLEPDAELTKAVAAHAHRNGVIMLTCGTYGNVIRLLPPLVIDEALLDVGLDILAAGLAAN